MSIKRFGMAVAVCCMSGAVHAVGWELKLENVYRTVVHATTNCSKGINIAISGTNIAVIFAGYYPTPGWDRRIAYSEDDGRTWWVAPSDLPVENHNVIDYKTQRLYLDSNGNPRIFASKAYSGVVWFRLYWSNDKGRNWSYVTADTNTFNYTNTSWGAGTGALFPDGRAAGFCLVEEAGGAKWVRYFEFPTNAAGGYDPPAAYQNVGAWPRGFSDHQGRYAVIDPVTGRPRCFYTSISGSEYRCFLGGMTNAATKTFEFFNIGLSYEGSGPTVAVDERGRYYMSYHRNYGQTYNRSGVYLAEFEYNENGAVQNLQETLVHEDDGARMASDGVVALGGGGSVIVAYLWSTNSLNGVPTTGQHGPCDVMLKIRDGGGTWHGPFVVASGNPDDVPAPQYPGAGRFYNSSYGLGGQFMTELTMAAKTAGNETFIYLAYGEYVRWPSQDSSLWTRNVVVRKLKFKMPQGTIVIMR